MKRSLLYVGDKDPYTLRKHIIQEAFYGTTEPFRKKKKKTISVILTTNEQTERFTLNLGKIITRTPPTEIIALFPFTRQMPPAYWLISESKSKSADTGANAWSTSCGERDRDPRPSLPLPLLLPCSGRCDSIASCLRPRQRLPRPHGKRRFPPARR